MKNRAALAAHMRLGRRGENAAVKLLKSKGFKIICRNWKRGAGELDIVALDGMMMVFVEVKSKRAKSRSRPSENLTASQKRRIRRGARKYISSLGAEVNLYYRYDLVEVLLSIWSVDKIYHHEYCYRERKK